MKAKEVLALLLEDNLQIAFLESMTGGKLISELVKHPGASKVCQLGLVLYSNEMKEKFTSITRAEIVEFGVVSKEIALLLATNAKRLGRSDIGVGVTGSAGPTAEKGSFVGEVWIGIVFLSKQYFFQLKLGDYSRELIIEKTVVAIYDFLLELLTNYNNSKI
ncbi:MAG: CinA family protein [Acholeplasmataceae bacterium]|jgi:nicotinamide-nucleotide amidase|nr:CinA family protein [Acholeplasmataceae bacterium]MCK9288808.1 CinA family protein [Acholeplasmataceae bacterium]MCK9427286.1 CinA family protein [Acholeplasmataceae bacterium]MDD4090889.1 CinA family protein [Acholeplasmataceae bacterium]HHT39133.1 CinA family protein [Acholeplasmataceae bacterium]